MGAAIATVFSQGLSAILCYLYMLRKFPILRATSSEDRRFHAGLARTLLAMGVPMGLQFSITAIGSIMLQSANNRLGHGLCRCLYFRRPYQDVLHLRF